MYITKIMYMQIRVSSEISNGSIILNLDCDMYANNPDAVREALCFFMDEKRGPEIAFMQHPQRYNNITKNDIYGNCAHVVHQVQTGSLLIRILGLKLRKFMLMDHFL